MFDLGSLEVTVEITLDPLTRDATPLPTAYMHQVNLTTLSEDPQAILYAIENHLAEHAPDEALTPTPDTSDPDAGLAITITTPDGTPRYAADIRLRSRSLEPAVACEQWGVKDIARYLGITPVTVRAYLSRGKMPQPDGYISGSPWWDAEAIREWHRPNARSQPGVRRRR